MEFRGVFKNRKPFAHIGEHVLTLMETNKIPRVHLHSVVLLSHSITHPQVPLVDKSNMNALPDSAFPISLHQVYQICDQDIEDVNLFRCEF